HHRVDVVGAEQALQQGRVADVADHQLPVQHRIAVAGAEVVQHHDVLAALAELAHHVAADVAGTAGDQDLPAASGRRMRAHRAPPGSTPAACPAPAAVTAARSSRRHARVVSGRVRKARSCARTAPAVSPCASSSWPRSLWIIAAAWRARAAPRDIAASLSTSSLRARAMRSRLALMLLPWTR